MSVPTDHVTAVMDQSRQAVVETVEAMSRTWVETARGLAPGGVAGLPMVPVLPAEAVDRFFDTGVQVLEAQRALVHGVLEVFRAPSRPAGR